MKTKEVISEYSYMGIDVAQKDLQVQLESESFKVANTPRGLAELIRRAHALQQQHNRPVMVVCEATGGYERLLLEALDAAGIARVRLCADRVRAFAKSLGIRDKCDPIDARVLLDFARQTRPQPNAPARPEQLTHAALIDRRNQLIEQQSQEKTRLQNSHPAMHPSIERHLKAIGEEIARIEAQITEHLAAHPVLQQAVEIITTIRGVGKITAWSIIAYLPELPRMSRAQAVALAGLAPYRNQSGEKEGRRRLHGGRAKLRKALYMPALASIRFNDHLKAYFHRRVKEGLCKMSALIATMRKLLIHIRSLLIEHEKHLA